jgi:dihydrofolate reductase
MRELKYYVACTVDRFIAAEDGSFDAFLTEGEHLQDLFNDYPETVPAHLQEIVGVQGRTNRVFDTVLMGRKTYEVGSRLGITSPYPQMKQYIFSRTMKESPDPAVELVPSDELAMVKRIKQGVGRDIWLCGGGALAAALFTEIDELILKVNPVVLGAGIPLFADRVPQTALELAGTRAYANGFALMRYRLRHG